MTSRTAPPQLPARRTHNQHHTASLTLPRQTACPQGVVSRVELPASATAPRHARAHVRETLAAWDADDDTVETAGLVVSELVTNAVLHATSARPIVLTLRRTAAPAGAVTAGAVTAGAVGGARLMIAVRDHDERPPVARDAGPDTCGGRGLAIVEAVAERWSWYRVTGALPEGERGGKVVWCELPLGRRGAEA